MKVKFKKLNENAVKPYQKINGDFCYDVIATSCEEIAPNVYKYGLGLAFEIERDYEFLEKPYTLTDKAGNYITSMRGILLDFQKSDMRLSLDFRPRSSVYKTGLSLANTTGTIDELFRGEVCAIFYHVMPNMPIYKVGDPIGQIKIGITFPIEFIEVDELSDTSRGDGGFGHTDNIKKS
jgi:dUTP pyrophosphatase